MKYASHHALTSKEFLNLTDGVSTYGVIMDFKGNGIKLLGIFLVTFQHNASLIIEVDAENVLEQDDSNNDAYDSKRIGYGITLSNRSISLSCHIEEGLLGSTHTRSVSHRTTEHTHHIDKTGTCNEVDDIGRAAGQKHGAYSQHVECNTSLTERREKSRTYLQTYGVDE